MVPNGVPADFASHFHLEASVDTTEPAATQRPSSRRRLPPVFLYERYMPALNNDDILGVQAANDQNYWAFNESAGSGNLK